MRTGSDNIHARNCRYRMRQSRSSVPASGPAPDVDDEWLPLLTFFGVLVAATLSSLGVPVEEVRNGVWASPSIRMGVAVNWALKSAVGLSEFVCFTFKKSVEEESDELPDSTSCPGTKTKFSLFRAVLGFPSSSPLIDNRLIARPGSSIRSGWGEPASLATSPICKRRVPHFAMDWYSVCSLLGSSRKSEKKLFHSSIKCA